MQAILNGLLIIFVMIYAAVIIFYIENVGFFQKIHSNRKNQATFLAVGFTVGVIVIAVNYFFENSGSLLLAVLGILFLIWLIRQKNYLENLTTLLIFGFGSISVINFPNLMIEIHEIQGTHVMVGLLLVTIMGIVLHWKLKDKIDKRMYNSANLKVTLLTSGTALLLFQTSLSYEPVELLGNQNFILNESLLFISLFILLGILAYINIVHTDRQFKVEKERAEVQAFEKYTAELEMSYDALRVIKHDYKNIMTSLKLHIDEKNMEALQEYYYLEFTELSESLDTDDRIVDQLQRVKVKELKSILLYKLNLATEMGLNVHVEVRFAVGNLSISKMIACQIVGILLDNTIEASRESNEKMLKLAIISGKKKLTIMIENSWMPAAIPMKKFFEKGFSTKGENRGLGLATVDELAGKYEQLELETEVDGERFIQILVVKEAA